MVTFSLHGTNFVRVLLLTWICSSLIEFRNDCVSNLSVVDICMGSFAPQVYCCNMIPLGGQSPQEQHSQNVTQEGYTRRYQALVMGVQAAGCCVPLKRNWVTALKSPKRRETPVAPKAVDKAVQVAALVLPMRSRMFREHHSLMAPFAIESDRVHLTSSAGSVSAVVVPLMISQRPTDRR